MDQQAQSRWRTTGSQVLWGIVIALVVLILIGYAFPWTGFGQSKVNGEIQPYKTLWDWLDLLIVPVVLAIGGYLFNSSQNQATRRAAELSTLRTCSLITKESCSASCSRAQGPA